MRLECLLIFAAHQDGFNDQHGFGFRIVEPGHRAEIQIRLGRIEHLQGQDIAAAVTEGGELAHDDRRILHEI